jgi:hypothetical protein
MSWTEETAINTRWKEENLLFGGVGWVEETGTTTTWTEESNVNTNWKEENLNPSGPGWLEEI